MTKNINSSFKNIIISLPVNNIKYNKTLEKLLLKTKKFQAILSSIKEIGVIENPIVYEKDNTYVLLDGHLRIEALKILQVKTVDCLIATDDEAFTYNKHVSKLTTIQEHKMIEKAVNRGASLEKIAKALNIEVSVLFRKKNLLTGICDEATNLLKDKNVSYTVFDYLRKMHPVRQIEASNLMVNHNNYTVNFARSILMASSAEQLIKPIRKSPYADVNDFTKLENEMINIKDRIKILKDKYGEKMLTLTIVKGYLKSLLLNKKANLYLNNNFKDIYNQFNELVDLELFSV